MRAVHAARTPVMAMKAGCSDVDGLLINDSVMVNVHNSVLLHFTRKGVRDCQVDTVRLGNTEMRLLVQLLLHANGKVADYYRILSSVWKNNDLVSSYKRMSQVVRNLKWKPSLSDLPDDFISQSEVRVIAWRARYSAAVL